jgi:hypothetical protein
MDIDVFVIVKEADLFNGEILTTESKDEVLNKISFLFYKLRRKIGQNTYIVPLETQGLTPLLKGFFS